MFRIYFIMVATTWLALGAGEGVDGALSEPIDAEQAAASLHQIGIEHSRAGLHDLAEQAWLRVKDEYPATAAWPKAVLSLGYRKMQWRDFEAALVLFTALRDVHAKETDRSGPHIDYYKRLRGRAEWNRGDCLLALGRYREALEAYRRTENEFPLGGTCGHEAWGNEANYRIYQGLCYDWLDQPGEAVQQYFITMFPMSVAFTPALYHARIVDLYEASGQLDDLAMLLHRIDTKYRADYLKRKRANPRMRQVPVESISPMKRLRRYVEMRHMAQRAEWDELMSLLKSKETAHYGDIGIPHRDNWEAMESARLLARNPDRTVVLIKDRIAKADDQDVRWLYYALGRCGTSDAVAALRGYALQAKDVMRTNAAVHALAYADGLGIATLRALETIAAGPLRESLDLYHMNKLGYRGDEVSFPNPTGNHVLPKTIAELGIKLPFL